MHICPEFTENQRHKVFEWSVPMPEKITYSQLQGEGLRSPDTKPLISHPFISLPAPSSASFHCTLRLNNTLTTVGMSYISVKYFIFDKQAFSDNSGQGSSPRFLAGAGRMLEVEGCRKHGQGTLWPGWFLVDWHILVCVRGKELVWWHQCHSHVTEYNRGKKCTLTCANKAKARSSSLKREEIRLLGAEGPVKGTDCCSASCTWKPC